jgi:hypothetical protein
MMPTRSLQKPVRSHENARGPSLRPKTLLAEYAQLLRQLQVGVTSPYFDETSTARRGESRPAPGSTPVGVGAGGGGEHEPTNPSPNGAETCQPRATPGVSGDMTMNQALKGRHTIMHNRPMFRPYRAWWFAATPYPGRCPGLSCWAPSGQSPFG